MINYVSKFSNNNTEYVIKDSTARSDISSLQTNKANDDEQERLAKHFSNNIVPDEA